jgi:hypothetical protein
MALVSSKPIGPRDEAPKDDSRPQSADEAKRKRYLKRWAELDSLYNVWWQRTHSQIIDYIQPNRGEFWQSDSNRGDRRDQLIIDNTAGDSARKLSAALDTGITSEAREWFQIAPEDPMDAENQGVREYCHTVQSILFAVISNSNFYKSWRNVLDDLVGPAIGLMEIEDDDDDVFRCTHVPIGSYRVAVDAKGRVNLTARRFTFTAAQMAEEFGEENCSRAVRDALTNETIQIKFQVLRIIEPRAQRQYGKKDALNKPWASVWLELGTGVSGTNTIMGIGDINSPMGPVGILRESGFDEQPFVCPRWNAVGMDAYGKDSPGWTALGDTKALQALQLEGAKTIAKIGTPPLNIPDEMRNASLLPDARNRVPAGANHAKVEPTIMIPTAAVTVMQAEKKEHRDRITRSFYGDVLFLISSGGESSQPATAEEIRAKRAEQLLQLGGVFSRISDEGLKIAIGRIFSIVQRRGLLPPPPPSLAKKGKLKLTFQNPLVTAQKTVELQGIQQLISVVTAGATAQKAGVDKIDYDELADTTADMLGVKPNILLSDEELQQRRQASAQQAQAQSQAAALQSSAGAVKQLSDANPDRLQQLAGMFGPNASAQATGGVQ